MQDIGFNRGADCNFQSFPAMLSFSVKPPPLIPASPFRRTLNPILKIFKAHYETERGIQFDVGDTFFRHESATGRDLGVLSAALYKQSNGSLRVLDAMCGCGIRSLRYLMEAKADFVLANDANDNHGRIIADNLSQVSCASGEEKRWMVMHSDAARVMTECYLQRDFFDLIDIDSFGSDSNFMRAALCAVKLGGLMYVTSTDGYTSGGHRPQHSLAAYGAYVRPMPYSNEIGLRMLIGGVVREASVLGYHVSPLFSYYSSHGPVFRVMLQIKHGELPNSRNYGFVSYCIQCGNSQTFSWDQLGDIGCTCNSDVGNKIVVSGPFWTGPLHDASHLVNILNLADHWEWTSSDKGKSLEKLIKLMIDESDPRLPSGYTKLDEISSRAKLNSPPVGVIMNALQKEGYAVSRSHIAPNAIKTNCPMTECVKIIKQLQQCSLR